MLGAQGHSFPSRPLTLPPRRQLPAWSTSCLTRSRWQLLTAVRLFSSGSEEESGCEECQISPTVTHRPSLLPFTVPQYTLQYTQPRLLLQCRPISTHRYTETSYQAAWTIRYFTHNTHFLKLKIAIGFYKRLTPAAVALWGYLEKPTKVEAGTLEFGAEGKVESRRCSDFIHSFSSESHTGQRGEAGFCNPEIKL